MNQAECMFWVGLATIKFFKFLFFLLRILMILGFKLLKLLFTVFAWATMFPGTRFAK
ncbi:hypothetical protein [Lactococcus petauri]|uniref:hypothetical protein n=1 Tax=Lactococcus petauri TaxID=1940789 RepID=UPI001F5779A8|nr:hypothetical protein [Lactococcus petauri]